MAEAVRQVRTATDEPALLAFKREPDRVTVVCQFAIRSSDAEKVDDNADSVAEQVEARR